MTIHPSDPFATPEPARSPVRRLRGRLPAAVTLWTAVGTDGRRAGLTVSSTVVADGDPGRLLGLLDDESALWQAIQDSRRFAVVCLNGGDERLADVFAGLMPAPGGQFAGEPWQDTAFGPIPWVDDPAAESDPSLPSLPPPSPSPVARPVAGMPAARTWVGCRFDDARPMGWALLIEATIEQVTVAQGDGTALLHYRGRYGPAPRRPPPAG